MTFFVKTDWAPNGVKLIDCVSRLSFPKNFFFFKVKSIFFSFRPWRVLGKLAP